MVSRRRTVLPPRAVVTIFRAPDARHLECASEVLQEAVHSAVLETDHPTKPAAVHLQTAGTSRAEALAVRAVQPQQRGLAPVVPDSAHLCL